MSLANRIETALASCRDQQSFFQGLLHKTLEWPVAGVGQVEEIAYSWSADELKAAGLERQVVDGRAWQIQPLERGQPWGIFVIEFKNPDAFTTGRGMAGVLRRILRGLVSSQRKDAGLPTWKRDHLLFICTHQWEHYKFAYFRAKFGDSRGSRLTTFGWGPGTSNRTVCEFNLPALEWPSDPTNKEKWVADWAKAFDKDRLTDDFFERFDEALERIKSDLEEFQKLKAADAYTQAQLLLERLIFLYFLQNRGWLNQDRRYLPKHLEEHSAKPEAFTYYKEFLDRVFWALSTPPGSSGGRLSGLPFLNGGLFDDDEFAQPSDLRKTNPPLKVRNKTFLYVFQELLEAFNFTVTEDTPLNQEVAVDPEMLGKVFESIVLHAEQADPDAVAPDKRKATGSYYTPRIVVHFICQEVLYQYLRNHLPPLKEKEGWEPKLRALLAIDASDGLDDEELETLKRTVTPAQAVQVRDVVKPLKCCDPAVGSGAFPVGLLHELVNLRRVLETAANGYVDPARGEGYTWLQKTKEDIVQNCLFGVDIQQQAIEICRLRLWLSLVVDYDLGLDPFKADKTQFNRAIDGISQLPNLEMNFHRGDSLHDHISGVPIVILPEKASRYADEFRAIAERGEKLHRAKKAEQKRKLRVEILGKRLSLSQRIIQDELKALDTSESALDKLFHDETESSATKRKRIAHEKERLQEALAKIEKDRKELEKLTQREFDSHFYVKLRKLEGADFDSPFNFAWYVDFPGIFAGQNGSKGGFDIIVGNPPFVTARNPEKRELWRERWPLVCYRKYHILCPFFELSFELLKQNGQLGFIVSNGFAKREFGQPLVEKFFPKVDIQKVVDCSGLMFPGHGTPTCLVFGAQQPPSPASTIRNIVILPGGGDLRTPPEESPLWHSIEARHAVTASAGEGQPLSATEAQQRFRKVYEDFRIAVGDCDRQKMLKHPCAWGFFDWPVEAVLDSNSQQRVAHFTESIGIAFFTNADEVFLLDGSQTRRLLLPTRQLVPCQIGEEIRNWDSMTSDFVLKPYDEEWNPLELSTEPRIKYWLSLFRRPLGARATFEGPTYDEAGQLWYGYHIINKSKLRIPLNISYTEIATHNHFVVQTAAKLYKQTAPIIKFADGFGVPDLHLTAGVLNSSAALFWLKQVCFNKGAGEDEERDRFVYAGNKVQQLPVPTKVAEALKGKSNPLAERLTQFSQACWERGQRMPALALRKLFEKPGEGYHDWNSQLSGYVAPDSEVAPPFDSTEALRRAYKHAQALRNRLRAEMIALQEEMDWLVYAAYGLLPEDHPAAQAEAEPAPLEREQRPFVLWAQAEGNYDQAVKLIPAAWPTSRKKVWEARLAAIRDNEHIRRIEQPVYKRRWDEQWKVGNQWRCGPIAYAAEFVDAFEWWLSEKAEWWLEHKKSGGPVEFDEWAQALWKDGRVQAAWPVAAEEYARLAYEKAREKAEENGEPAPSPAPPAADFASFKQTFREIADEETVPEGFPFGTPYDELEKKLKRPIPGKLRKVRGKLNVPRERFHLRGKSQYLWAGLQFQRR